MKRLAVLLLLLTACNRLSEKPAPAAMAPLGDATRGKMLITHHGCNVCHIVPGIAGPQGSLGPSLDGVGARPMISNGVVQNTPTNLEQYIADPQSLNPQSTMPPLGLAGNDAKDITAYLVTLR